MIEDEIRALELSLVTLPGRSAEGYLREVVSEDFRELGASGQTYDKEEAIAALLKAPPPPAGPPPELVDFRVVEVGPGVALATYRTPLSLRSSIWRREGARFRICFHQGSRVPEDAKGGVPPQDAARGAVPTEEQTCGQELAGSAHVPEQVAALFEHVAQNLRAHAAWVGTGTAAARGEHDAMIGVALGYEGIGAEARRTAELMRTLANLPPVPHDPARMDREKLRQWMKLKVGLQRGLARLLDEHAAESEAVLRHLGEEHASPPGKEPAHG